MNTVLQEYLGIDLENDSVNICLEKFRATSPGLTMTIMPQKNGEILGLLLFCSDPENAQKIKEYSASLD